MSARLGTLQFIGNAGSPLDFHVFDDAIVVVEAGRRTNTGLAFGAIGGAIAVTTANRQVKARRAQADAVGNASAAALADAVDGAQLTPLDDIAEARLQKALAKGRKLKVRTRDGTSRTFRFASNRQDPGEVGRVLGAALGDRFVNEL